MKLDEVMTLKEAAKLWGKSDSTLRMMLRTNKLIEGKDYRKSDSTWLITKKAMIKVYGEIE